MKKGKTISWQWDGWNYAVDNSENKQILKKNVVLHFSISIHVYEIANTN